MQSFRILGNGMDRVRWYVPRTLETALVTAQVTTFVECDMVLLMGPWKDFC